MLNSIRQSLTRTPRTHAPAAADAAPDADSIQQQAQLPTAAPAMEVEEHGFEHVAAPADFELAAAAEKEALSAAEEAKLLAMVSLKAPEMHDEQRTATSLVVAADVSGSMAGDKLELMKQTLRFVVTKGLTQADTFGLVSFHSQVKTELPLTKMDAAGKRVALQRIDGLRAQSTTNLSGGLLQALDLHAQVGNASQDTRAVMLFTDGHANGGIMDTTGIVTAMQGVSASLAAPPCVFTFGFGRDHNEDMLQGIADAAGGQYYFVEDKESIPQAFGDALGGLVSVVAQNVEVTLSAQQGIAIDEILSQGYTVEQSPDGMSAKLQIGDLYSEDEKDLLVRLRLPAQASAGAEARVVCAMRGFDVRGSAMFTREATITIARPETAPAQQAVNVKIDEQRNRLEAAEAMKQAAQLADAGQLAEGRELLLQVRGMIEKSPAASSDFCQALSGEMMDLEQAYADEREYMVRGSKLSKMSAQCHMQQRSNHASAAMYEKKGKKSMKAKMSIF